MPLAASYLKLQRSQIVKHGKREIKTGRLHRKGDNSTITLLQLEQERTSNLIEKQRVRNLMAPEASIKRYQRSLGAFGVHVFIGLFCLEINLCNQ